MSNPDRAALASSMLQLHDEIEAEKNKPRPNPNYLIRLLATAQQQCLAAHVLYLTEDQPPPPPADPRQMSLFPDDAKG